jgi:hypothetical protein
MTKQILTQEELKEYLSYNPMDGVFTWLKHNNRKDLIGKKAGTYKVSYIHIWVNSKSYMAHRLAWLYMTGEFPDSNLDHKDCNGHNNKWENIRKATDTQNCYNRTKMKSNTSGYKGVYFVRENKYRALSSINSVRHHLGYFKTAQEAAEVYRKFAKEHHGEFYRE